VAAAESAGDAAEAYGRLEDVPQDARQPCRWLRIATLVAACLSVAAVSVALTRPPGSDDATTGMRPPRVVPTLPAQLTGTATSSPCGVNVIIARHCNKRPPWAAHPTPPAVCTQQGMLRGENMAHIFGAGGRFPAPTRLFARKMREGFYSSRDLYLLWPLAQRYGLMVNLSFAAADVLELSRSLLEQRPQLCGETVVVSWDHCLIPAMAQALGCRENPCLTCWDDRDYDTLLWLRYDQLLPGGAWNVSLKVEHEGFGGFDGPSSYRECWDNIAETKAMGYPCTWTGKGPSGDDGSYHDDGVVE